MQEYKTECSKADILCECGSEYTLPDYMGDIRRVLACTSRATPSGRFIGNGEVQCAGIVSYELLYTDPEGKLWCAPFTADYEFTADMGDCTCSDSQVHTRVQNTTCRPIGPRRVNVKSVLSSDVLNTECHETAVAGTAFDGDARPETAETTCRPAYALYGTRDEREYAEEGDAFEGVPAEEFEIVGSFGTATVREALCGDDFVTLRGDIEVSALVRHADEPPFPAKKIIRFDETVPLPGARADMCADGAAVITSATCTTGSSDGGDAVLKFGAIAEFSAAARTNGEITVITDAYDRDTGCVCEYGKLTYSEFVDCRCMTLTASADAPREDCSAEDVRDVIFSSADLKNYAVHPALDGVHIEGNIVYTGIGVTQDDNGKFAYKTLRFEYPIDETVRVKVPADNPEISVRLVPAGAEATLDSARLYVHTTLQLDLATYSGRECEILLSCDKADGTPAREPGVITVYYPDRTDTLWSVAKRYRIPAARLAADNNLSAECAATESGSLAGVKKLIIR